MCIIVKSCVRDPPQTSSVERFVDRIGARGFGMADADERSLLHFVLIHGAFHGAWAWYRLEDALQKAGCKVSAMDMAGAGIHPADPDSIATWEEYHKPALDFFANLTQQPHEKVVLVGHSMGAIANLMLMERYPHKIDLAVFVAAIVIPSGVPFTQDVSLLKAIGSEKAEYRYGNGAENAATSFSYPMSTLHRAMYSGLDSEILALATKLIRPYPARMLATPIAYTEANHGQVPAVYIRCAHDDALAPAARDYIVAHYGPFREVIDLDGGHFEFLKRPKAFTEVLVGLANRYPARGPPLLHPNSTPPLE